MKSDAMGNKENAENKVGEKKSVWKKNSFDALLGVNNVPGNCFVEDKGGGGMPVGASKENGQRFDREIFDNENGYVSAGAVSCLYDDEAAAINFHSNRTSRNNSSDNLSYSSDNFYPEDLIFLEDDEIDDNDGAEVDDISLNSDDCVYAYRGDGAEFDFPLEPVARRAAGIAGNSMDDEMDFLEMDFEPDTLSEIENGGNSVESEAATAAVSDALYMQRDGRHIGGRHSSTPSHMLGLHIRSADGCPNLPITAIQQRQLFSSPIDDMPAVPLKALHTQTLLGKNFGRMSLHLDQIKGVGECVDSKSVGCESAFERMNGTENYSVPENNSIVTNGGCNGHSEMIEFPTNTAHSLPNTLHTFGREHEAVIHNTSPSKITGAKPKRLSTFSTSSSTSSKNSSKSRTSLRSVIGPSLFNSSSFDERSVSCTEFRSAPPPHVIEDGKTSATSINVLSNPLDLNEESCLDCLEKEFLASTIGKALEPNNCPKCRRKRFSFFKSEFSDNHLRCRSGSPSFFTNTRREHLYELPPQEYVDTSHKDWPSSSLSNGRTNDIGYLFSTQHKNKLDCCMPVNAAASDIEIKYNAAIKCDISGEQLLKNLLTDKEIVPIPTSDVTEEILLRAFNRLNISFKADLLHLYFERETVLGTNFSNSTSTVPNKFNDLKHFLLHESKKNCNHPRLKHLIEIVAHHQIEVIFEEDPNKTEPQWVNVNVAELLRQWTRNNNIDNLRDLDNRFKTVNILGKIATIIRQNTQAKRCLITRAHSESIAIPQYYPSGFLILKRKLKA